MPSTSVRTVLGLVCLVALAAGHVQAADQLIPGNRLVVSSSVKVARMVAVPPSGGTFALPATPPTVGGVTVDIVDTGGGSPPMSFTLQASKWRALGNPPGSTGYAYQGAGDISDPCKGARIRPRIVSFVCRGLAVTADPPYDGSAAVTVTVGSTRYCASFGGTTVANTDTLLRRTSAPPPGSCAGGPGSTSTTLPPTTTSTTSPGPTTSSTSSTSTSSTSSTTASTPPSTSTTTSTSSTTSSTVAGCCNNAMALSFSTFDQPGDCGDLIDAMGVLVTNMACSGLYTGGGGNSVPLPFAVPDLATSVTAITTCSGQTATVGGTTSVQTGSNRTCTSAGCLFGGPLAVPNPGTPPTSVCVLNTLSAPPSGTVVCNTGATNLDLPLSSVLFLTGDTSTDPSASITGVQPCPVCRNGMCSVSGAGCNITSDCGGGGGTCVIGAYACTGGVNNGMACTPSTSTLNNHTAYPTSHDCPPDPMFNIGTLPIAFNLQSGTVTWSGTNPTNDTGSTASVQNRVFAGFCRDADATLAFETPFNDCWLNGVAVGPPCSGTFESCEQRSNGAFGPNGGANRTVRVIGNSMSILAGPSVGTLVSVFGIPPTFDPTVDSAGDLPGPGAVSLVGSAKLCATASPCP